MFHPRLAFALSLLVAAGCAAPRPPGGFAMQAADEPGAASLLAGYLLARGWTVRLAEPVVIEAAHGSERLRLEPLLDADGLDRILVVRSWPAAAAADPGALADFARELNETLNVGQFLAQPEALLLQVSLPFLEALEPRLLEAFLDFTAEVRLAVLHVQGERSLVAPLEGDPGSR